MRNSRYLLFALLTAAAFSAEAETPKLQTSSESSKAVCARRARSSVPGSSSHAGTRLSNTARYGRIRKIEGTLGDRRGQHGCLETRSESVRTASKTENPC
jgi:hypothetical protein